MQTENRCGREFGQVIERTKTILSKGSERFGKLGFSLGFGLLLFGSTAGIWENPQNLGPNDCPYNSIPNVSGGCNEVTTDWDLSLPGDTFPPQSETE